MFEVYGLLIAGVIAVLYALIGLLFDIVKKRAGIGFLLCIVYAGYFELMRYHLFADKVIHGIGEKKGFIQQVLSFDTYAWLYIIYSLLLIGYFIHLVQEVKNHIMKKA